MRDEDAARQIPALTLAGLSAPAALTLAGFSWHWALLGGAAAAGFFFFLYRMCEMPLARAVQLAFGRTAGGVLLVLTLLWTVFAAGAAAAGSTAAYPEDGLQWLAPVSVLLLAAFAGRRGSDTVLRAASVLLLMLGLGYAVLLLAATGQVELQWCRPWGSAQQAAKAFFTLLAAQAALYLPQAGAKGKKPGRWCALMALVPAACACAVSGVLSPQVVQRTASPFYVMSKSLSVVGVAERFEPVVSAAMLTGFFCLTGLLTQSAGQIAHTLCPRAQQNWCAAGACVPALAAVPLAGHVPQAAQTVMAGIFWGFLPVLTLGIVAVKKGRNNSKKRVDKRDFLW